MLCMSELREYGEYLRDREMSENTVEKYLRDAENFLRFSNGREISRELMMEYKSYILNAWKISSVNSMITAVNSYLKWAGQAEFSIHTCRVQKQIFREKSRELGKEEYYRLLNAAVSEKRERLSGILRTIAATGMRIGELRYLTVETLSRQKIEIHFKGKQRVILMARSLVIFLRDYCRRNQDHKRDNICHKEWKSGRSEKYLGGDEGIMRTGESTAVKGVSTQSETPVCEMLL